MRRLKIVHRTYYNFSGAVQLSPHRLLLRPRSGYDLRVESLILETSPASKLRWLRDAYDNAIAIASFSEYATQLSISSEVIVQHFDETPLDFLVSDYAVQFPFTYEVEHSAVLYPYMLRLTPNDNGVLSNWVAGFWQPGVTVQTYSLLQQLCVGIHRTFSYLAREEPGVQTAAETLARGTGSCRDLASLFMEATRSLGLATRFVSGYLHAPAADWNYGATHAWAEVYLPGAGWKGFDPTIGEMVGSKHIAVAVARMPESVPPVSGSFFGPPGATMNVGVWVTEL